MVSFTELILTVLLEATTFAIILICYMQFELQHYVTRLTEKQVSKIIKIFFSGLSPVAVNAVKQIFISKGDSMKLPVKKTQVNMFEIKPFVKLFIAVVAVNILSILLLFVLHRDVFVITMIKGFTVAIALVICYYIYSNVIISSSYLINPNDIFDILDKQFSFNDTIGKYGFSK